MSEKPKIGFAAMDPQQQREIARRGGRMAQLKGTGHRWTSTEARVAGRKGGQARHAMQPDAYEEFAATDLGAATIYPERT